MRLKKKMKRIGALFLSASLMLSGIPFGTFAEDVSTATDLQETHSEDIPTCLPDEIVIEESEAADEETCPDETESDVIDQSVTGTEDTPEDEVPDVPSDDADEATPDDGAAGPDTEENAPSDDGTESQEEEPAEDLPEAGAETDPDEETESPEDEGLSEEETVDDEDMESMTSILQDAIDADGHAYALTYGIVHVFADEDMNEVLYTTEEGWHIWLVTGCSDSGAVAVYCLDEEGKTVKGYLPDGNLDEELITDEDISWMTEDYPSAEAETAIGTMCLFTVAGVWAVAEADPAEETDGAEDPGEPDDTVDAGHRVGDYIAVTKSTRVFDDVDDTAMTDYFPSLLEGCFTKNATVQIQEIQQDDAGNTWYCVRYLYGDDFANGTLKWTSTGSIYVLASETTDTEGTNLTVTDYAYTQDQLDMMNSMSSGIMLMFSTTAMNGFTLKNISGKIGSFYAWQSGLYGSSGKDSAYPQIAKSAAHGTIYATPHYLEGYTVYCLEHNLSGPGEGSGSSQTAKGPYVLVDMDTFVNDPDAGGVSGVQYSAKTMHALAWVLRHTYPFMVLNRSDSNNETWSRVAGQFAIREVIKQLEGSQYVRSYWDMDNFYAFSGGAPAVYLEYARWLAENGIARSKITGKITAKNQSLTVSGTKFIGKVTLTTDADLIRIPKSCGSISGNSGGSDSNYYYVKSGDTISITTTAVPFTVTMESISSDEEEANFLVGIPSVSIQKILVPIDGEPYPLQSGSLTFELKLGEIKVTKMSSDGILLTGTTFELLNSSGTVLQTATTGTSGVVTFESLEPGTYTVREKTASQGYTISATSSQNITVTAGATTTVTFKNERITGKVRIVKKDSVTDQPLPGATFTVTRLSGPESDNASDIGQVVATITTNANGIAETGLLPWGEYRITETGVPDDYLDDSYTVTTWIK